MMDCAYVLHNVDMKNGNPNLYFYKKRQRQRNPGLQLVEQMITKTN